MSGTDPELRPWSSLGAAERARLLAEYQPVLDCQTGTCEFSLKVSRMQEWLATRGVSITEDEILRPRR